MNPSPQLTELARCITARQDSGISNRKGEHSSVLVIVKEITPDEIKELKRLLGTVFQIYAAEDITTLDGTVRAYQGELVDEITTDKDGKAKSKELYLGKYTVIEKTATDGFYNPNEQYDVELTYAGQNVSVTSTELSLYNERQKVTVSIAKTLEQDETFGIGMNDEIKNVQFGIYANEDIKALDGSVIPKDALITYASCDENGNINFSCDLPIGFKWYSKEIAADEHYVLSDEKYEFNTKYQGQEVQTIEIAVNDGEPIANELIYGTVKGIKTDRETGKTIEGAVFGLFRSDETEFTEENAVLTAESDKNGIFTFDNVPYGEWIVKELHPAENYLPSDDIRHITVSEDEQIIEINAVNDMIPELKTTASIDGEKEVEVQDKITIDDIVEYKHLVPGKEYIIKGVLMNKATNKPFTVDGKEITSEVSFVPEKPNGEVNEITFPITYQPIYEGNDSRYCSAEGNSGKTYPYTIVTVVSCIGSLWNRYCDSDCLSFILNICVSSKFCPVKVKRLKYNDFCVFCYSACVEGKGYLGILGGGYVDENGKQENRLHIQVQALRFMTAKVTE